MATSMFLCSSPAATKSTVYSLCSSVIPYPKAQASVPYMGVTQLGLGVFSPWNGLKHVGLSIAPKSFKIDRRRKCKGMVVYASLFGVGAPEALVIGVVALLVFGPKGLAEVARTLGRTLRAFQPTIRELQDVSREFKSTLEREIGLDDNSSPNQNTYSSNRTNTSPTSSSTISSNDSQTVVDPNGVPLPNRSYTSEEYLKVTEEQLKAAAAQPQDQRPAEAVGFEAQDQTPRATGEGAQFETQDQTTTKEVTVFETQDQTHTEEKTESGPESHPQATIEETAAVVVPLPKTPETET